MSLYFSVSETVNHYSTGMYVYAATLYEFYNAHLTKLEHVILMYR